MRKYQPIWEQIKKNKTASISAPVENHRRIILAVRKEKTYDLAWKLECLDSKQRWKLKEIVDGHLISFYLEAATLISYAKLTPNDL